MVMVRVLSNVELPINFKNEVVDWGYYDNEEQNESLFQKSMKMMSLDKKKKAQHRAIVLHVHGGGFIAMNSAAHQSYTRLWANNLNIPVFSVDYRLSPQYKFPAALNDVWQVYYWLVENAEAIMGLKVDKIILAGDSAGGNLVAALTVMAIERKYRIPDGLILAYPAITCSQLQFVPSLLMSMDDPILGYPFMKMCLDCYVGGLDARNPNCVPETSPYISPLVASDETLKQFPKTRIMIASSDPLRDQGLQFAYKLLKNDVDTFVKEYMYFPHGFLSMGAPIYGMKDEVNESIRQVEKWILECIMDHTR
mmetsp:Transcript_38777/g.28668  ORF Transcript_38777/g.28668 Transcript_38777/m.28668 type:complete len:309 (+) Transcript_38777:1620-2546(+)